MVVFILTSEALLQSDEEARIRASREPAARESSAKEEVALGEKEQSFINSLWYFLLLFLLGFFAIC